MKLVVALAVVFAGAAIAWMILLPRVVARVVRQRTGFDVQIQSLYCNPFTADLTVRGLVITNPSTFPQRDFVDLRGFKIDARWLSLLGRRWEVNDAAVDIAKISIVRDQEGRVNARIFQEGLAGQAGIRPSAESSRAEPGKEREFLVRHLTVRIDRLLVADYSLRKPETREYNLNFSHTYENVTSARQLAAPLAKSLGGLAGVLAGTLPESNGALRDAGDTLKAAGRKTGEALKGFLESLEKRFPK